MPSVVDCALRFSSKMPDHDDALFLNTLDSMFYCLTCSIKDKHSDMSAVISAAMRFSHMVCSCLMGHLVALTL